MFIVWAITEAGPVEQSKLFSNIVVPTLKILQAMIRIKSYLLLESYTE